MTSFGDERPSVVAARKAAPPPEPEPETTVLPPQYPTQAELEAIHDQAFGDGFAEGRAAGHAEGREAGHADGHAEGYQAGQAEGRDEALQLAQIELKRQLAPLLELTTQFGDAVAGADQLIANDVLELALHLAKGMLKTALAVHPELILPVVREAIEYLPTLQQPALLVLHPDDAQLVRDGIGEELDKGGWRVIEDAGVGRGGCKIDTASNQIDAQAESRWQRLTHALGKNVDWLGP